MPAKYVAALTIGSSGVYEWISNTLVYSTGKGIRIRIVTEEEMRQQLTEILPRLSMIYVEQNGKEFTPSLYFPI